MCISTVAERNVVCSPDANRRISHPTSKRMPRHYSLSLSLSLSLMKPLALCCGLNTGNGKQSFLCGWAAFESTPQSSNFSPRSFCCLKCVSFFCSDLLFYSFLGKRKIFKLGRGSQWLRDSTCGALYHSIPKDCPPLHTVAATLQVKIHKEDTLAIVFFFFWVQVVFLFHRLRPYYFIIFLIDVDIYLFHAVVLKICRLLCVCSE